MEWSRFYQRRRKFHPKKSDPIDSSRCKFNILSSKSHDFHIELVGTRMPVALVHQSTIDLPGGHICNKLSFGLLYLLEPCLVRILDVNGVMGTTRVPEACVMHDPKWSWLMLGVIQALEFFREVLLEVVDFGCPHCLCPTSPKPVNRGLRRPFSPL